MGADQTRVTPLQAWQLFTLAGLIGATIVVFCRAASRRPAGVILLSLIVFAAAAVGIAALRTFLPLTLRATADAPDRCWAGARALRSSATRALVLRSIKELEFDRAMGKVSDKDFAEMSARLRTRAARIIRQLDAGAGYREQIEQEIERRIGAAPADAPMPTMAAEAAAVAEPVLEAGVCGSCSTRNDPDARFCKECGQSSEAGA